MPPVEYKFICRLEEIPDRGAIEAEIAHDGQSLPLVILREGDSAFAYVNICPHQGRELNYAPGKFMVRGGVLICAHHGASYRVSDGACLGGPCRGAGLRPIPVLVQDGVILLREDLSC